MLCKEIVRVWIRVGNQVIIQRRSVTKAVNPDRWDASAAGHIHAVERPHAAAIRETFEELGIELDPMNLKCLGTFDCKSTTNHVFLAELNNYKEPKYSPEDASAVELITFTDLIRLKERDPNEVILYDEERDMLTVAFRV